LITAKLPNDQKRKIKEGSFPGFFQVNIQKNKLKRTVYMSSSMSIPQYPVFVAVKKLAMLLTYLLVLCNLGLKVLL
jgi:hypothetical protein